MNIYVAHPITGLTPKEVIGYFTYLKKRLEKMGWGVLQPMTAKGYFRTQKDAFRPAGFHQPASTNHAIFSRDNWMVRMADVVLVDLTGAKEKSIGCIMEIGWAADNKKHVVLVMEKGNVHEHAFILEAAHIIYPNLTEALNYLEKLAQGKA